MSLTVFAIFGLLIAFLRNSTLLPQYSEMIKIRLQRHGAKHAPFYRMVVARSQSRRDGKFIEVLGTYNPQAHTREEELKLKIERIDHWLGVGAQPTDTAKSLIRQSRMSPEDWLKRSERLSEAKRKRKNKGETAPTMEENAGETEEEKPAEDEAKEEAPVEENEEDEPPMEGDPTRDGGEESRFFNTAFDLP